MTLTEEAAQRFISQGFEVSVLPLGATPHVSSNAYFKEFDFGISGGCNLAIRSRNTVALEVDMHGYPEVLERLETFGQTFQVNCGPKCYLVYVVDRGYMHPSAGRIWSGDLAGAVVLEQGILAFGKIWNERSGLIVDVQVSDDAVMPLPKGLAQLLVFAQKLSLFEGAYPYEEPSNAAQHWRSRNSHCTRLASPRVRSPAARTVRTPGAFKPRRCSGRRADVKGTV